MNLQPFHQNQCCPPQHVVQACPPVACPPPCPSVLQLVNSESCPLFTRDSQLFNFFNNLSCPSNALPVTPCQPRVTGTTTSQLVDDITPLVLAANSYRTVKVISTGAASGTIDGIAIVPGETIEITYPDHVDTPILTITGAANPDELLVITTNYTV